MGQRRLAASVRGRPLSGEGEALRFLDKVKATAWQALHPVGPIGERDKIIRITKVGVRTPATVNSMREVGRQLGAGHQIEFDLMIHPVGGDDYQVHVSQSMQDETLAGVTDGASILVRVDPEDPQSLLVWRAAG